MLEEGELLEGGIVTGFRLCSKDGWRFPDGGMNKWSRTFSVRSDPTNSNIIYLCSQNGQLRVLNTADGNSKDYHVLFRRFAPAYEGEADDSRPVPSHWDKMTPIPGRPGEVIFLMGVSKTIMYTTVPGFTGVYPREPLIARATRGDLPHYIYGTPIIEISSHSCRVSTLASSPSGHLLASADERGYIKLLVLVHKRERGLSKDNLHEWKKHQSSVLDALAVRPTNIRMTAKVHDGPVFSLEWLPVEATSELLSGPRLKGLASAAAVEIELIHCYCLATGSSDRLVRLWRVAYGIKSGLSLSPILSLSTLATHVLCLNSYLSLDGEAVAKAAAAHEKLAVELDSVGLTTADILKGHDHGKSVFTHARINELLADENSSAFLDPLCPSQASLYVAGGTNAGLVYVWKMTYGEVYRAVVTPRSLYTMETAPSDEGARLHSLVQSSDHPVVHVALSSARDRDRDNSKDKDKDKDNDKKTAHSNHSPPYSSSSRSSSTPGAAIDKETIGTVSVVEGVLSVRENPWTSKEDLRRRVILAATDTQGCVRTHCESDAHVITDDSECTTAVSQEVVRGRDFLKEEEKEIVGGGPIVLCGESFFGCMVVSCHFRESSEPLVVLQRLRRPVTDGEGAGVPALGKPHQLDHMVSAAMVEDFLEFYENKLRRRRQKEKDEKDQKDRGVGQVSDATDDDLVDELGQSSLLVSTSDGHLQLFRTDDLATLSMLRGHVKKQLETAKAEAHTSSPPPPSPINRMFGDVMPQPDSAAAVSQLNSSASPQWSSMWANTDLTSSPRNDPLGAPHDGPASAMSVEENGEAAVGDTVQALRETSTSAQLLSPMSTEDCLPDMMTDVYAGSSRSGGNHFKLLNPNDSEDEELEPRTAPKPLLSGYDHHNNGKPTSRSAGSSSSSAAATATATMTSALQDHKDTSGFHTATSASQHHGTVHFGSTEVAEAIDGDVDVRDTTGAGPLEDRRNRGSAGSDPRINKTESEKIPGGSRQGLSKAKRHTAVVVASPMAVPAINTSQVVYGQLRDNKERLENADNITITTIDTTSTDRRAAARAVSRLLAQRRAQYYDLPAIGADSADAAAGPSVKRPLGRTRKQVDPTWLMRRQQGGPSAEDMAVLVPPEPLVELRATLKISGRDKKGDGKCKKEEVEDTSASLQSEIDPVTLLPRFTMEVNLDHVFGPLDVLESWAAGAAARRTRRQQSQLNILCPL